MGNERKIFSVLLVVVVMIRSQTACAKNRCPPSSCGNIHDIHHPFRLQSDPESCGRHEYGLSCENNRTILYLNSRRFHVQAINYNNYTIRATDPGIQKGNCSSIPENSLVFNNRIDNKAYGSYLLMGRSIEEYEAIQLAMGIIFLNCENPAPSSSLDYIDISRCVNGATFSPLSQPKRHAYVVLDDRFRTTNFYLEPSCRVEKMTLVKPFKETSEDYYNTNLSYIEIHNALAYGFELSWLRSYNRDQRLIDTCSVDEKNQVHCRGCEVYYGSKACSRMVKLIVYIYYHPIEFLVLASLIVLKATLGYLCAIAFLIFKWRRRHLSMYDYIEEFLQSQNNLMPIRYSYSDIKKMAKGFKEKLGEGGYGSVYKGKLRSGHLVAIKMLGKSKSNGQDFINEVATIGRIHHMNVVQLIGFCVEGSKRALVYEFMPNGSLDKHIFPRKGIISIDSLLNCAKIFEISLGVARAIKYLHQGCDMQILHFDIKPHNILLDENFVPKVSDFGLARLCPLDDIAMSLTAARGTLGYIAPEFFYKNIGRVSHKSDIYSFGMLLMEMANRRKNLNPVAETSSQIYFPSWVSGQILEGNEIEFGVDSEEESRVIRKMMIVALWCIQLKPCDRPSMNKVLEMLETELDCLQVPQTKFSFSPMEASMSKAVQSEDESSSLIHNSD